MPTELLHISDDCYVIWTSPCSFSTHPEFSAFCLQCLPTHLPRLPLTLTNTSLKSSRHSSLPPTTLVPQQGGILALFHCSSRIHICFSASAHQVYLGRGLRRTVDMFHSARELVDENDRRTDLIASGEDSELNAE
jgi:hypothetical protein